ncbi:MAG: hypothetical protein LBG64_00950, partial [Pseudomonadales bacterium]|nr:hypothetical protein [Pseudomonadales bacterium]
PWDNKIKAFNSYGTPTGFVTANITLKEQGGTTDVVSDVIVPVVTSIADPELGLIVRVAPRKNADRVTRSVGGSGRDPSRLANGDTVKNVVEVKGDEVDGWNGWYRSPRGTYFSSRWTNRPFNVSA